MKRQLSIILAIVFMLSSILAGCGAKVASSTSNSPSTSPVVSDEGKSPAPAATVDTKTMSFKESPMLEALVKAGKLPPVKDRLPEHPRVITQDLNEVPSETLKLEIGQYGGVMRIAAPAAEGGSDLWTFLNEAPLTTPGIQSLPQTDKGNLTGSVFESFEFSPDYKVFTFHMRKGLKWSDGVPVTTEDVKFVWEDIYQNKELTPVWPSWLRPNQDPKGTPGVLEVKDDLTFKISFDQTYSLFLVYLASKWNSFNILLEPKHYFEKFHIKYAKADDIKKMLVKEKFQETDSWTKLFYTKKTWSGAANPSAIGRPTLQPWIYKGQPSTGILVFERNPYYFKVDAEGNQLPYIDRVEQTFVTDMAMKTMKIISGEVDFSANDMSVTDFTLFKENETKGGYNAAILKQHATMNDIFLNLTNKDPVWRKVVNDVRFRKALTMGINRQNIIDVVQLGYGGLPQFGVPTEYNPEAAKKLLDEMGMDKKDSDGWRLGPDGKRFVIPFEIPIRMSGYDKVVELVSNNWQALGISTTMKIIDLNLYQTRREANDLKTEIWSLAYTCVWADDPGAWYTGLYGELLDYWGVAWRQWYMTQGKKGEEPPAEVKALIAAAETVVKTTSIAERSKAMDAAYKIYNDNVFNFPISVGGYPMTSSKKLGNIPSDKEFGIAASFSAEQFFYKK